MKGTTRSFIGLVAIAMLAMVGCGEATQPTDNADSQTEVRQAELGWSGSAQDRAQRRQDLRHRVRCQVAERTGTPSEDCTSRATYTTDGKRIAYRVYGTGSREIVMVHGWMLSGAVYDNLIGALESQDYKLIIPDLRGTGDSDKPSTGYTLDNYQKDVLAVTRAEHAGRFVLVGHSMGGAIAQYVATNRPGRIEGLVLMSPVPASGFPLPQPNYDLFWAAGEDAGLQRLILQISSPNMSQADVDHLAASAATLTPEAIRESLDTWTGASFAEDLDRIQAPTLVLVSDDPFMPTSFLQQTVVDPIADAQLNYFPGSGHYLLVEDPQQTSFHIDQFVSGLP